MREGEGVAPDAGAEVEEGFARGDGLEALGLPGGDGKGGGLFHRFGGSPDEGELGDFFAGLGLDAGEGEGGVDVGAGIAFSQGGDLGDGGVPGVCGAEGGDQGEDLLEEGPSDRGMEKIEGVEGDPGIVWSV